MIDYFASVAFFSSIYVMKKRVAKFRVKMPDTLIATNSTFFNNFL